MPIARQPVVCLPGLAASRRPDNPLSLQPPLFTPDSPAPAGRPGSRRRKLWELPHKLHCPLVGVCFDVDELRAAMQKVMYLPTDTGDYLLHTTAVGSCENRSPLAEVLQKKLERNFARHVRHCAAARSTDELRAHWRKACASGSDIPATLWVALTHPVCDALLEQEIYGEIHMIQHQLGSTTRAAQATQERLRGENQALRRQLAAAQGENERLRREKAGERQQQSDEQTRLHGQLAARDAEIGNLRRRLAELQSRLPDLKDRQALLEQAERTSARIHALTTANRELTAELQVLRNQGRARYKLAPPCPADGNCDGDDAPATMASRLDGKCILCVGGRAGAVDAFRLLVERQGGRFLHHDGGQEDSLHRIDGALSAADLVVCQAGCISHNAYWRVKERCKRSGKQCHYIKSSGVSSFSRIVNLACRPIPEEREA